MINDTLDRVEALDKAVPELPRFTPTISAAADVLAEYRTLTPAIANALRLAVEGLEDIKAYDTESSSGTVARVALLKITAALDAGKGEG